MMQSPSCSKLCAAFLSVLVLLAGLAVHSYLYSRDHALDEEDGTLAQGAMKTRHGDSTGHCKAKITVNNLNSKAGGIDQSEFSVIAENVFNVKEGLPVDVKIKGLHEHPPYLLSWITQGSLNHVIRYLSALMAHFDGPVHLTVFLIDYDFDLLKNFLLYTIACVPGVYLRLFLHFATYSDLQGDFMDIDELIQAVSEIHYCGQFHEELQKMTDAKFPANYEHVRDFPVNFLRNVGLQRATTEFVIVVDMDILPNPGFYTQVADFLKPLSITAATTSKASSEERKEERESADKPQQAEEAEELMVGFVVPVFEQDDALHSFPADVNSLLSRLQNPAAPQTTQSAPSEKSITSGSHIARVFYSQPCPLCQLSTNYKKWYQLSSSFVASESLRTNDEFDETRSVSLAIKTLKIQAYTIDDWRDPYEPFFVARRRSLPRFSERFRRYGKNRLSQLCELHVAGWEWLVLTRVYLLHDGLKSGNLAPARRAELNLSKLEFEEFKLEVYGKYPHSTRRC